MTQGQKELAHVKKIGKYKTQNAGSSNDNANVLRRGRSVVNICMNDSYEWKGKKVMVLQVKNLESIISENPFFERREKSMMKSMWKDFDHLITPWRRLESSIRGLLVVSSWVQAIFQDPESEVEIRPMRSRPLASLALVWPVSSILLGSLSHLPSLALQTSHALFMPLCPHFAI